MSLIDIKNKMKKKKPRFLRTDGHKLHLPQTWRKPRGMHNKMRIGKKGHGVKVDSGYRSPKEVRYMHFSNLNQIMIYNFNDIKKLNPKTDAAIIASSIGAKKKIIILEECMKLNIKVLNITDPKKFVEEANLVKEISKKSRVAKDEKRKKSKEESLKKSEEKKEKELTKEEKKEEEKETERKILEKEVPNPKEHSSTQEKVSDKVAKTDSVRARIPQGGDRSA